MSRAKAENNHSLQCFEDVVGFNDIQSLDVLAQVYLDYASEPEIPTDIAIQVLRKELHSENFLSRCQKASIVIDSKAMRQPRWYLGQISDRMYYFLWSLKNQNSIPVEGLPSTKELYHAVVTLTQFIASSEFTLNRNPKRSALHELLAQAYFDLASIIEYAPKGIRMLETQHSHATLLRKAIASWQKAVMLDAAKAQAFDKIHTNILNKVGDPSAFSDKRASGYLNPWHFLYIASALHKINDEEAGTEYLKKAQWIIDQAANHQSPKIVTQKTLLEAVCNAIRHGQINHVPERKPQVPNKKADNPVQNGQRRNAAIRLQKSTQLQKQQLLQSIETIYQQVPQSPERNRLIFHLNIPPFRKRHIAAIGLPRETQPGQPKATRYADIRGLADKPESP